MARRLRHALMALLGGVFLFSVCFILVVRYEYSANERLYQGAAEQFTAAAPGSGASTGDVSEAPADGAGTGVPDGAAPDAALPPIAVDFAALQAVNGDVCGWIHCDGTPISYPVLQGEDNDAYLRHSYEGAYATAGSIFVEAQNSRDFADSNTIVYGHHMRDGSMFACLDQWAGEGFYEEHPILWLLTPGQDYRIDLIAGYTTSGYSDTYTIFTGPCTELEEYLEQAGAQSDFEADVKPQPGARYVVLSTCAYVFTDARYVLHGMLVPVESAGGVPF